MPLLNDTYKPPLLFRNSYVATIYAGVLRPIDKVMQYRERIALPDGDFLDIDWSYPKHKTYKLVILLHGLEGNAQRTYMLGSAAIFNAENFAVCAVNFRGCSGVLNTKFRSYHSGATDDLDAVTTHILKLNTYTNIYLEGFSLGGNLLLKYLGAHVGLPKQIKGAVAISVPCQLGDSLNQLLLPKNKIYAARFKKRLIAKLLLKRAQFPDRITMKEIHSISTLKDFDNCYTSKAHGFKNADDYYNQCSSRQFLLHINIPTLIINAKNDSFLGNQCYPVEEAKRNKQLFLEIPKYGGHVGFYENRNQTYTERRALHFFSQLC